MGPKWLFSSQVTHQCLRALLDLSQGFPIPGSQPTTSRAVEWNSPSETEKAPKPATGISFTAPNLPTLIADCIALGNRLP